MLAIALVAAQYAGTLDLFDTTSVTARSSSAPPVVTVGDTAPRQKKIVIAADVSTLPTGRLVLRGRSWDAAASYAPTFTVTDVELPAYSSGQQLHSGSTRVGWHDRFVHVFVSEAASYGQTFLFQQLAGQGQTTAPAQAATPGLMGAPGASAMPGPAVTAAPTNNFQTTSLAIVSSSTNGTVMVRAGRRLTFSLSAGYVASGGATSDSKRLLAESYGPLMSASVTYVASRRDSVTSTASAQEVYTSGPCIAPLNGYCFEKSPILQAQETLRHQLSAASTLTLGAGASLSVLDVPTANVRETAILPVASASVSQRFGRRRTSTLTVSANLAPLVDFRTGLPGYRVQPNVALTQPATHKVSILVNVGVLKSVPFPISQPDAGQQGWHLADPAPFTGFTGALEVRLRLDREHTLGLVNSELWQYQSGYGTLAATTTFARLSLNRELDASLGTQTSWQAQAGYGTLLSTSVFVAATVRALPLRF